LFLNSYYGDKWWKIICTVHVAHTRDMRNEYKIVSQKKIQGKRPLGRCGHRSGNNIKIDSREIGCEVVNWS
jgi:hypothetical protein